MRAAMKPLPTLMRPLRSVDLETGEPGEALVERSDVAAVEALAVVAEAAVAFELARAAREKFGGDALRRLRRRLARVPGAHPVAHALDRHLALVGFMGAGKTTLGAQVAERLGRRFVDLDRELEQLAAGADPELFERARRGGLPCAGGGGRRSRRLPASRPRCSRSAAARSRPSRSGARSASTR